MQVVHYVHHEYTTGIIERGCGREADKAREIAECLIRLRDHIPSSIISVVYKRGRCFNWFVALLLCPAAMLLV